MNTDVATTKFVSRPRETTERRRASRSRGGTASSSSWSSPSLFALCVWAEIGDNPILPVSEAINETLRNRWWICALVGLELLRQIHYVIAEHRLGVLPVLAAPVAGAEPRVDGVNPWTRFRIGRIVKSC